MHRTRALGALARGRGLGSQARPAAAPAARTFDDANPFHNFFDSTPGSDQPNVFAGVPTSQLSMTYSIFRLCSTQWLIGPLVTLLRSPAGEGPIGVVFKAVTKQLVFPHFCAGEHLSDCHRIAGRFHPDAGVRIMVDHSIEEGEGPEDWAVNLVNKSALLRNCREQLGDTVVFVPVKMTALVSPQLLEAMSVIIAEDPTHLMQIVDPRPKLDREMLALLDSAVENMSALCGTAAELDLPLLFDAEQSHRQDAMDFMSQLLMERFNPLGARPIVYNTYQMYMVGAGDRVRRDLDYAQQRGYTFAAKVVRGAYLVGEAQRAEETGHPNPLHSEKTFTDDAYDGAVRLMLERLGASPAQKAASAIVVATHNTDSVRLATDVMRRARVAPTHPNVHFGQIMGMCDHLTNAVGLGGYNSLKLVLYGDFDEVFPWLLRRMDENRDLFGSSQQGLPALGAELTRRRKATGALLRQTGDAFNALHARR